MTSEISKIDQPFVDALKTAATFDEHLEALGRARKFCFRWAVLGGILFLAFFVMETYFSGKGMNPHPSVLILAATAILAIHAAIASGEIRTLLMFRHLSELSKATTE